jgi:hypothetical protein
MPLKVNMTRDEIVHYLRKDLTQSVRDDVKPCIRPRARRGGYFSVPRLVLCYVDYLGVLYRGGYRTLGRGRRRFAEAWKAKAFLRDIFGKLDYNYAKYGGILWEIYRNGPIHLYEPMKLRNHDRIVSWFVHKGPRSCVLSLHTARREYSFSATHLVPHNLAKNTWVQPISIVCLYEDLLASIDKYAGVIQLDRHAEERFRETANALKIPEITSLVWW